MILRTMKSCLFAFWAVFPTLAAAQTAPTISNVTNKTTLETTTSAAIAFTIGDAETLAADLVVTATSSDLTLIPAAGILLSGSESSRTVTLTPASGLSGSATITLTVTDADLQTITDSFVLTVHPVYSIPGETIPDLVMDADASVTVNYQIPDATWVSSASRTNITLLKSVGTSSSSAIRLQPTSGGTARTLRIKPDDRSTSVGFYGISNVTLALAGSGAPTLPTFLVRVNPRAVADNNLLGIPGTTSTFDVLANDVIPLPGHAFAITAVTTPAHGTVEISASGSLVRYTPTAGYLGPDAFEYTVTISSADEFNGFTFTGIGYVTVGNYIVVDSPTAAQHTDIGLNYTNGVWTQNIESDAAVSGSVESGTFSPTILDSDEGVLFLDPSTKESRPADSIYDFIGIPAGAHMWRGPSSPVGDKIYLGIASEETSPSTLIAYETADPRAVGTTHWVETRLVNFTGPGHFAAFDFTSPLRVHFDTADGVNSPTDAAVGVNPTDTFFGFAGSHAHINWVFTQPGRYALTFRSRVNTAAGFITSPDVTYYFNVDTITNSARLGENPPLVLADAAAVLEDSGPFAIDVLTNDSSSPDPLELLTITGKTDGTHGTVAHSASGLTYTPAVNFAGSDSFTYTVADEHGGTATASVAVTVTAVNDAPIFAGYSIETPRNQAVTLAIATLLAATSDPENDTVTLTAFAPVSTASGTVTSDASSLFYQPPTDFTGADTFTVTFSDSQGAQTVASIQIGVIAPSPPSFTGLEILPNAAARISYTGVPGRSYRIERSLTLADDWTPVGATLADESGNLIFLDPEAPADRAFYRCIALP